MNIYIPVEIKVRELEGRLLLALAAAERGHEVFLGDKGYVEYLLKQDVAEPGIIHHKSILPYQLEDLQSYKDYGHKISVQDEEHGLLAPDYKIFATMRFSPETLRLTDRIYCWGQFDHSAITDLYSITRPQLLLTGSPRVDFWRDDMDQFYFNSATAYPQPYVLFVSNQGHLLNVNRLWLLVRNAKYLSGSEADDIEADIFRLYAWQAEMVRHFLLAIRSVSKAFPNLTIVVRPHPTEVNDAWSILLEGTSNVLVTREGALGQWIRHAAVVVHEGCTSGFEAVAMGRPVIAYEPIPPVKARPIPNELSLSAKTKDELLKLIAPYAKEQDYSRKSGIGQVAFEKLLHRFPNLEGLPAVDRIVSDWETMRDKELEHKNDWSLILQRLHPATRLHPQTKQGWVQRIKTKSKRVISTLRKSVQNTEHNIEIINSNLPSAVETPDWRSQFQISHKFPSFISDSELEELIIRIKSCTGRFLDVEYERMGPRQFLFKRKN
jgi:surface carbohydrate biosynthesis protein